jgi:hypothetical protein
MMKIKWHLGAVALLSGAAFLLAGCSFERPPVVLGPRVVNPGAATEEPTPSDNAGTPGPADSSSPAASSPSSPAPSSPAPSARNSSAPPDQTPPRVESAADCGPGPAWQPYPGGASAVPSPFRDDQAELDADGQAGDGRSVIIDEVQLTRTNGFVAVCLLGDNRLLGSLPIARSIDDKSVRVSLAEPITVTSRLLVVLYADDGDGRFDGATDRLVSGDDDDITDLEVERLTYRYTP